MWIIFLLLTLSLCYENFFEFQAQIDAFYFDVCDCTDGSLAITGIENDEFVVSRYDEDIEHTWTQIFTLNSPLTTTGKISCVCCGDDHDIIVSGSYVDNLFVMKFSSNDGNLLWGKKTTIGDVSNRFLTDCQTSNYFVVATTEDSQPDLILMELNSSGSILSSRRHSGYTDHTFDSQSTSMKSDGGFLVSGIGTYSLVDDSESGFTLNFDPDGQLLWGKIYNFGATIEEWTYGSCETDEGDIVMVGHYYYVPDVEDRCFMAKWDSVGTKLATKFIDDSQSSPDNRVEWCWSCAGLPDSQGKVFVLGKGQEDSDLFLVKNDMTRIYWRVDHSLNDYQDTRGTYLSRKGVEDSVFTISSNGVITKYSILQLDDDENPEFCPSGDYDQRGMAPFTYDSNGIVTLDVTIDLSNTSFSWTNFQSLNTTTIYNSDPNFNCWSCVGVSPIDINNTRDTCSDHGTCEQNFECECDIYWAGDECERSVYCPSPVNGLQCTGHGECLYDGICNCTNYEIYSGELCQFFSCFGINNTDDDDGCSYHGECVDINSCNCSYGYVLENCSEYSCFGLGYSSGKPDVCSGHGICLEVDHCECTHNYTSSDCSSWSCFGNDISTSFSYQLCSGHGECIAPDNCTCSEPYHGENCELWTCWNISNSDFENVCSGHGVCIEVDACLCADSYTSELGVYGPCEIWGCHGTNKDSDDVCHSRGECVSHDFCECDFDFKGDDCETYSCNGIDHRFSDVCNGRGNCILKLTDFTSECDCDTGYAGQNCEYNYIVGIVMGPIFSVLGLFFCLCFSILFCCCCCTVLGCCFGLTFLVIALFFEGSVVGAQKVRMNKYAKLRDFDLLLQEQLLEDDSNIAHLKVNKKLFEIPFDEIKTTRILGRGGSQSVVFEAVWRNMIVAFKCFKTQMVCSNQNDFDQFEKEVQILSSLNHPHIIRFFGASLKPPRVGIVMEFCCKGEIINFFQNYEREVGEGYPVDEIIRLCGEIVAALDYCHSRNIIHRDLKCENVLIDGKDHVKLMDFGLSRVIDNMEKSKNYTKNVGTNIFMSPEVVTENRYDTKCDVFSFSILFYVLLTKNPNPYRGESGSNFRVEFKVASDRNYRPTLTVLDTVFSNCEEGKNQLRWVKYIIKRCWSHEPSHRMTMSQVEEIFKKHLLGDFNMSTSASDFTIDFEEEEKIPFLEGEEQHQMLNDDRIFDKVSSHFCDTEQVDILKKELDEMKIKMVRMKKVHEKTLLENRNLREQLGKINDESRDIKRE